MRSDRARWSERMDSLLGSVDAPMTRASFLARVDPRDRRRIEAAIRRALTINDAAEYEIEYRVQPGDGAGPRWVAARATTLRHQSGRPGRTIGPMMDSTERN